MTPDDTVAPTMTVAGTGLRFDRAERRIVTLLFTGGLIAYMDRAAFGVLAPYVKRDLHLSAVEIGIVLSFFGIGYAAFVLFAGYLTDRFGAKRVVTVAMISWSLFCAGTGLATGLVSLLVVRFFFGISEAPWPPAQTKMVHGWFATRRFTTVSGLIGTGLPLGAALTGPVVGVIALYASWRWSFAALGGFGLVWSALWMRFAAAPPAPEPLTKAIDPGDRRPILSVLREPPVLASAIGQFAFGYILYFFLSWFPSYLVQERHLSLAVMSIASAFPWIAGIAGVLCGGLLATFLAKRPGGVLRACKTVIVAGLSLSALCIVLVPLAGSTVVAVALMAVAVFGMYATAVNYLGIVVATVPAGSVGVAIGFSVMMPSIAGIIAPAVTGWLIDRSGSFASVFPLTAAVAVAGALAVGTLAHVRRPMPWA